ncbi:MAG: type II secretion system protein GspM [Halioglobus sp.]
MKAWFARYNPREQLSLLLLAAAVVAYVLYFFTWSPIATKRDEMAARNHSAVEVLQRVDAMVSEVLRLRESGEGVSQKRNLTSIINQSTSKLGLAVSRLQPNSRGEVQVRLEAAVFDDILKWLHEMEYTQGLLVREVSITQTGTAGRVNASVRIAQGA